MLRGFANRPKGGFKLVTYLFIVPMGFVISISLILILMDVPFNLGFLVLLGYSISGILAIGLWIHKKLK